MTEFDDFSPTGFLKRTFTWWWVIVLLMIAGGAAGYLGVRIHKPVYESTAEITTSIDFAYAGKLEDYEEDQLILAVGDLIGSTVVMEKVSSSAKDLGLAAKSEQLGRYMTKSRQGYRWVLSCRAADPKKAKKLCQSWLNAAMDELALTRQNSIDGFSKLLTGESIAACFSQSVVTDPASAYCSIENMRNLQLDLRSTVMTSEEDTLLRSVFLSKVSFQATKQPDLPDAPVIFQTNLAVLAGAFLGLIASLTVLLAGFPRPQIKD